MGFVKLKGADALKVCASRILSILLTVILVASMFVVFKPTQAFAADDEAINNSFASVASAASDYMDIILSYSKEDNAKDITVGNIAGAMGVVDEDSSKTIATSISRFEKQAANVYKSSYVSADAYNNAKSKNNKATLAAADYGYYGYALNYLGLDETAPEQTTDMVRLVSGALLQATWTVSGAVDGVMAWCIHMLQVFNPFQFVQNAVISSDGNDSFNFGVTNTDNAGSVTAGQDLSNAGANAGGSASGAFQQVKSTISDLYNWLQNLSWAVILPLFLALAIFTFFLGRIISQNMAAKGASNLKKWVVRVFFILFAIPLLGSIYTPTLNAIGVAYGNESDERAAVISADRIVVSQLVDFEAWAEEANLSAEIFNANGGHKLQVDANAGGMPSGDNLSDVRKYAATINQSCSGINITAAETVNSQYTDGVATALLGATGAELGFEKAHSTAGSEDEQKTVHDKISNLIQRYTQGARYTSSSFVTFANQELLKNATGDFNAAVLTEWVQIASDPQNYATNLRSVVKDATVDVESNNYLKEKDKNGSVDYGRINASGGSAEVGNTLSDIFNKYMSGDIDQAKRDEMIDKLISAENDATNNNNGTDDADYSPILWLTNGHLTATGDADKITYSNAAGTYGLSTIGMYNYLNTVFANDGLYVYSTADTQNLPSMQTHYSVSSVGSSLYGLLLMGNSIALLAAFSIIGLVYGLGMLFSNLKRSIQLVIAMPFAMIGVMASMARVFMLVLMMIAEILIMFFLYKMICQILLFVNDILTTGVQSMLNSILDGGSTGAGTHTIFATIGIDPANAAMTGGQEALGCLALLIAIVLLIIFVVFALKIRSSLTNMCNELIGKISEKFFENNGGSDAKSNMGSKVAQGAMLGATMLGRSGGGAIGKVAAVAAGVPLAAGAAGIIGQQMNNPSKEALEAQRGGGAEMPGTSTESATQNLSGSLMGFDRQASGLGGASLSGSMSGNLNGDISGQDSSASANADAEGRGADASANAQGEGSLSESVMSASLHGVSAEGHEAPISQASFNGEGAMHGLSADSVAHADAQGGSGSAENIYGETGDTSQLSTSEVEAQNANAYGADINTEGAQVSLAGSMTGEAAQPRTVQAAFNPTASASAEGRGEAESAGYGASMSSVDANAQGSATSDAEGFGQSGDTSVSAQNIATADALGATASAEGRADSNFVDPDRGLGNDAFADADVGDINAEVEDSDADIRGVSLGESVANVGDIDAHAESEGYSRLEGSLSGDTFDSSQGATPQTMPLSENIREARGMDGVSGENGASSMTGGGTSGVMESTRDGLDSVRDAKVQPMNSQQPGVSGVGGSMSAAEERARMRAGGAMFGNETFNSASNGTGVFTNTFGSSNANSNAVPVSPQSVAPVQGPPQASSMESSRNAYSSLQNSVSSANGTSQEDLARAAAEARARARAAQAATPQRNVVV